MTREELEDAMRRRTKVHTMSNLVSNILYAQPIWEYYVVEKRWDSDCDLGGLYMLEKDTWETIKDHRGRGKDLICCGDSLKWARARKYIAEEMNILNMIHGR